MQRLDESGLFNRGVWQETKHYKVSFQVTGRRGARVFVTHDEPEFLISNRALKDGKFPDSETLYDFLLSHAHGTVRGKAKISAEYIEAFIDLIRAGLQENPKSRRASRSSATRRQPASKRTTSKSTAHMSAMQQLRHSKLFDESSPQKNGSVRFHVKRRQRGTTIYVTRSEQEIHIREQALLNENNGFPIHLKLYDFVNRRKHGTVRHKDDPNHAFKLKSVHIQEVIELIRIGLKTESESLQTSRSTRRSTKRSIDRSTSNMTVLGKFKRAFPRRHRETKSNDTVSLGKGATVYFRKTSAGPNEARIHSGRVSNFPNASKLESHLKRSNIPIDPSESHPDYKIGPKHADRVIAILKEPG